MRPVLLLWLLTAFLVTPRATADPWDDRTSRDEHVVLEQIVQHPNSPTTWFAVGGEDTWVSYDAGRGWRRTAQPTAEVEAIALDGTGLPVLCASGEHGGTWTSRDGAATWERISHGAMVHINGGWEFRISGAWKPPGYDPRFAGPDDNLGVLYAATSSGVFFSPDQGSTWDERKAWLEEVHSVDIWMDPEDPQHVVVLTRTNAYRSTNGGRLWAKIASPPPGNVATSHLERILEVHDGWVTALTTRGEIIMVDDGGWRKYETPCQRISHLPDGTWICANPGAISVNRSLYSTDWEARDIHLARPSVQAIAPRSRGGIYAALDGGGVLSSADGIEWAVEFERGDVEDLATDRGGMAMVAFASSHGILIRPMPTDRWHTKLQEQAFSTLDFAGADGSLLVVGGTDGTVLFSRDLGWSYEEGRTGLPTGPVIDIHGTTDGAGKIFAVVEGQGVWHTHSPDGRWSRSSSDPRARAIRRIASAATDANDVWAAAGPAGFLHSADGATTWESVGVDCAHGLDVAIHPSGSGAVALGCVDGTVWVTQDGGQSWASWQTRIVGDAREVEFVDTGASALAVGTDAGRVYSGPLGGGATSSDRFSRIAVEQIAFSNDGRRGLLLSPDGMYYTVNGGKHWEPAGEEEEEITGIDISEDGWTHYAWAVGKGLRHASPGGRWEGLDLPRVDLGGCEVVADRRHPALIAVRDSEILVAERLPDGTLARDWYSHVGSGWQGRGRYMACMHGDVKKDMFLAEARELAWTQLAGRVSAHVSKSLAKTIKRKHGFAIRQSFSMGSKGSLVISANGEIGMVRAGELEKKGQLPEGYTCVYMSRAIPYTLYVGTADGILLSDDLGVTFDPL